MQTATYQPTRPNSGVDSGPIGPDIDCYKCGLRAVKKLGQHGYCDEHLNDTLGSIRARLAHRDNGVGTGMQVGPLRLDWGDGWCDLECDLCGATWVGLSGERCTYCQRHLAVAQAIAVRRLLRPSLPATGTEQYAGALTAWVKQLAEAVRIGLISQSDAFGATHRVHGRTR